MTACTTPAEARGVAAALAFAIPWAPEPSVAPPTPEELAAEAAYARAEREAIRAVDGLDADGEPRATHLVAVRRGNDARPEIDLSRDYTPIVDDVIHAIARLDVYQRGGHLTDAVRDAGISPDGLVRHGAARLRLVPPARLRELADAAATYWRPTAEGGRRRTRPGSDVVAILAARGEWSGIRPLAGVVTYPVTRPDGTVLTIDGYDSRTALLAELPPGLDVPTRPTRDDARRALEVLSSLVGDFPFASDVGKACWLAALLTPLARPAIDGPTPLLVIDANTRGAGKTLLADVIGGVILGQRLPRRSAPGDDDEWRKAMLAIAIAADSIVLVDNVTQTLRAAPLDAVLTGTSFRDRILGRNEELSLEVRTAFIVTANNATVSADLVRRSIHCRLASPLESPEQRSGFALRLPDDAIRDRARYLSAALSILRAYVVAGRPTVELRPMGSYDAWTRAVRAPLVWAGAADPALSQDELRDTADTDRAALAAVLVALHDAYQDRAVTTADVLAGFSDTDDGSPPMVALRDALRTWLDDRVTPRRLGYRLRSAREQIVSGLVLRGDAADRKGFARWTVHTC